MNKIRFEIVSLLLQYMYMGHALLHVVQTKAITDNDALFSLF